MTTKPLSRRTVLGGGVAVLAATTTISPPINAHAEAGPTSSHEDVIRRYYAAWETKDWQPIDVLLTDDFTFSSANNDDHISKSAFKEQCWESQKNFIKGFDLRRVFIRGNEAFVMYVGRTMNNRTFRNIEYLRLRDSRVQSIECYFGQPSSFPSAVSGS